MAAGASCSERLVKCKELSFGRRWGEHRHRLVCYGGSLWIDGADVLAQKGVQYPVPALRDGRRCRASAHPQRSSLRQEPEAVRICREIVNRGGRCTHGRQTVELC